jgi:hypothetical protein
MRVQRTRSSASPPPSPLTRGPLGATKVWLVLITVVSALGCRGTAKPNDDVLITLTNNTGRTLNIVNVSWSDDSGMGTEATSLGPMRPWESKSSRFKLDRPKQIIINIWSDRCPATSWGPYLVPGTGYSVSVDATESSTRVATDGDCYTRLTIRGSMRVGGAA